MNKILEKIRELRDLYSREITLEKKIILTFAGSLAVFFFAIGFAIISRVTENNLNQIENSTRAELVARDNALLSIEKTLEGKIKGLSKETILLGEPHEVSEALRGFAKDNEEFSQVMFAKADGEYTETPKTARETAFDPRNTVWYKDALAAEGGSQTIVTVPFQGIDGKAKIGLYKVMSAYGYPAGVVGGTVDFSILVKISNDFESLIVLDNDDNIVFDGENSLGLFKKLNKADTGDLSLVGHKNEGISKIEYNKKNMLAVVYKSDATKLKYIKLLDANKALSNTNTTKYIIIFAFVSMIIISLGLCKLLYKDIKKSFMSIEAQTEAIGEGKLDDIANVKESSDEVGRLSFAFGKMAGNVKSRLMTMETESQNLRAVLREICDKTESAKVSVDALLENLNQASSKNETKRAAIADVISQSQTLNNALTETTDLQDQCKNAIMELAKNLGEMKESFLDWKKTSEEKFKRETEEYNATFKSNSKNLYDQLQKFADSGSEISLMAFSAALEAAKGKDKKSKFAKIAEDIRKLADAMSKSAGEALKEIDKFTPKIVENPSIDMDEKFSQTLDLANEAKTAISSLESTMTLLETAGKNALSAVNEISALEEETDASVAYALKAGQAVAIGAKESAEIADRVLG